MNSFDIVSDGRTIQIVVPSDLKIVFSDLNGPKIVVEVEKIEPSKKPGPKVQPIEVKSAKLPSVHFHELILAFLANNGECSSDDIRADIKTVYPNADDNSVSWALVELQNEGCKRGKNRPKTGPIVKTAMGYRLR